MVPVRSKPRTGTLVYLMGPSGSGKDSLIDQALAANLPNVVLAPRLVTRQNPSKSNDLYLPEDRFLALKKNGELALHWTSHGYHYAIDNSLNAMLGQGLIVLVNGSRDYFKTAKELFPSLLPILITADPQILKARLENRAREDPDSISKRLLRTNDSFDLPLADTLVIDNSSSLELASNRFISHLKKLMEDG
ncbi:MAG: AAA family ATPase [Deltaproteobacteria bacterium]|jgi:ribose 1,5-bisphosphokinase|nr:AAA family ATPase [Deltaproteobacteria bacterium]